MKAACRAYGRRPQQDRAREQEQSGPENMAEQLARPKDREAAEMWADYRAFKAAGLLHLWRQKWAAKLGPRGPKPNGPRPS